MSSRKARQMFHFLAHWGLALLSDQAKIRQICAYRQPGQRGGRLSGRPFYARPTLSAKLLARVFSFRRGICDGDLEETAKLFLMLRGENDQAAHSSPDRGPAGPVHLR
jgi:hypothetical protein